MLTIRIDGMNSCSSVVEIDWACIHPKKGKKPAYMTYRIGGTNKIEKLTPEDTSQAFVMNDNGTTIMSHGFKQ